ncbi:hypothetical protein [Nocardioides caldifontis]|uniref:hypothetical protein n=1 Tax=Nocardioides caldifontis TaxID=2588938 RepID=UPI0011DF0994|nr:hypothetical protein [Nocardioides caldifontis]
MGGAASSADPLPDLDERECAPGFENYHLRGNYLKERHDEGYCGQDLLERERRPRSDRRG